MNDHQSKDLSIETNSFNHNKGTETEISANDNHGSLKCATDNRNVQNQTLRIYWRDN